MSELNIGLIGIVSKLSRISYDAGITIPDGYAPIDTYANCFGASAQV